MLVLAHLERRLVHPRLAGLEHVLQVVLEQLPLVVVVLAAVRAGDDDPLHALDAEDPPHAAEVLEVRADVLLLA